MDSNSTPTSFESQVREVGSKSVVWTLKNWTETHEVLVAGKAHCILQFEKPKVSLRFFLRPVEKTRRVNQTEVQVTYYSLCADVLESDQDGVIKMNIQFVLMDGSTINASFPGGVSVRKSRRTFGNVVSEQFMAARLWTIDSHGLRTVGSFKSTNPHHRIFQQEDISMVLKGTFFELGWNHENDCDDVVETAAGVEAINLLPQPEVSLVTHMKAMYVSENNFSDLKLETKDNLTLNTHKFILAARSPVFRTMLEKAVKTRGFEGVLKIGDVNAKPMLAIFHWMYTDELHENVGSVLEEVVEAAVKYQLGDLFKMLDNKLIEICNARNMFQLFQVAKKIPMPKAIEDISLFIKRNRPVE